MSGSRRGRILAGPLVSITAAVAVAWLAAGALLLVVGRPTLLLVGLGTVGVALALAVMAVRMVVRIGDEAVTVLGQAPLPRADIVSVGVTQASRWLPLYVPVVTLQRGRAVTGVDLDGLSSFGARGAHRAAERLATQLGIAEVEDMSVVESARPRRGWDD